MRIKRSVIQHFFPSNIPADDPPCRLVTNSGVHLSTFSKGSLTSDLPLPIPQTYPVRALTSECFFVRACWFQAEHNVTKGI